jgi:(1->4)-alpha-D-glucan 1-alpha-D-glucosylmutase
MPSTNDQYLFFQTVVGAWPFGDADDPALTERITAYMLKATREAKLHTSWITPDQRYEDATTTFVTEMLGDPAFTSEVRELVARIAPHGACNSLAQLALRLASPGVPDIYQGTELWDLSLVDPDNRRPVDYQRRRGLLAERRGIQPSPDHARALVDSYADGRIKLHVTHTGLAMRHADPLLFLEGSYRPLDAGEHVVAFERARGSARLVCVVPRLPWKLTGGATAWPLGARWGDTRLALTGVEPDRSWRNVFTGEALAGDTLALRDVLATFPVAWLVSR